MLPPASPAWHACGQEERDEAAGQGVRAWGNLQGLASNPFPGAAPAVPAAAGMPDIHRAPLGPASTAGVMARTQGTQPWDWAWGVEERGSRTEKAADFGVDRCRGSWWRWLVPSQGVPMGLQRLHGACSPVPSLAGCGRALQLGCSCPDPARGRRGKLLLLLFTFKPVRWLPRRGRAGRGRG